MELLGDKDLAVLWGGQLPSTRPHSVQGRSRGVAFQVTSRCGDDDGRAYRVLRRGHHHLADLLSGWAQEWEAAGHRPDRAPKTWIAGDP